MRNEKRFQGEAACGVVGESDFRTFPGEGTAVTEAPSPGSPAAVGRTRGPSPRACGDPGFGFGVPASPLAWHRPQPVPTASWLSQSPDQTSGSLCWTGGGGVFLLLRLRHRNPGAGTFSGAMA